MKDHCTVRTIYKGAMLGTCGDLFIGRIPDNAEHGIPGWLCSLEEVSVANQRGSKQKQVNCHTSKINCYLMYDIKKIISKCVVLLFFPPDISPLFLRDLNSDSEA